MAWYDKPETHGYIPKYEPGVFDTPHFARDIETDYHENITSLVSGTVDMASYPAWGGQVRIKPDAGEAPNKKAELYYYHLDEIDVPIGAHVKPGDIIGIAGGETQAQVRQNPSAYPGAKHPVQNTAQHTYSTGPHTHVGWEDHSVFVPQTGNTIFAGPDIEPWLQAARGNITWGVKDPNKGNPTGTTCTAPTGPTDVAGAITYALCQMQTGLNLSLASFLPWATARVIRTVFMIMGVTFVVIGVKTMLKTETSESAINITGARPAPSSELAYKEPGIVKKATHAAIQGAAGAAGGVVGERAASKFLNRSPKTSGKPKP